jgi:hypothetical protein
MKLFTLHLVFTPLHDVAFVRSSNPEPKTPEAASFHQKVHKFFFLKKGSFFFFFFSILSL